MQIEIIIPECASVPMSSLPPGELFVYPINKNQVFLRIGDPYTLLDKHPTKEGATCYFVELQTGNLYHSYPNAAIIPCTGHTKVNVDCATGTPCS